MTEFVFKEKKRKTRYKQVLLDGGSGVKFDRIMGIIKDLYPRRPLNCWGSTHHRYHIDGNFTDDEVIAMQEEYEHRYGPIIGKC